VDEPHIPAYYVVNPTLTDDQKAEVGAALKLHPVLCAIIWRDADRDLAALLAQEIVRTNTELEAHDLAEWLPTKAERPAVVIGGTESLAAVYSDGKKETLL
jgi:hypothetical protein